MVIEQKYAGAVAGDYRANARTISLTNLDNATEMVQTVTVSVSGVSVVQPPQRPALGTSTTAIDLSYACHNSTLRITIPGATGAAWNLNRTGSA